MIPENRTDNRRTTLAWALALIALFALRLPHLAGPLDDPHSWRQCDTVNYTWDFYRHGIDLLHPSVCWLGGHRTLIFELALPEAIASLFDRAFGFTPLWDRLVALAFTGLAAAYLYAVAREISDRFTARVATAIFLLAPLSQFFSRAPQVDFAAAAFAHGLLYHGLRSARGGGARHAALAAACGALAAMIKGPYLAPVMFPLALGALGAGSVAAAAGPALAALVSAIAFVLWRRHVSAVNAAAPDWTWLPNYYKEVNPWWWYVGNLHQRLQLGNWIKLAKRFTFEIATPAGVLLAAGGALLPGERGGARPGARVLAIAWLAGAFAYLLVFFPLNVIHNYYQIPFIAPLALLAGLGLRALTRPAVAPAVRACAWLAFAALVALALVSPGRLQYYRIDELRESAARAVAARVPEGDLVVVVDHNSDYSDPRLLGRARRNGWAVEAEDLTPALLAHLEPLGARWVAWVSEPGVARLAPPPFLAAYEVGGERLLGPLPGRGGRPPALLGELHLYRLAATTSKREGTP